MVEDDLRWSVSRPALDKRRYVDILERIKFHYEGFSLAAERQATGSTACAGYGLADPVQRDIRRRNTRRQRSMPDARVDQLASMHTIQGRDQAHGRQYLGRTRLA